MSVFSDSVRSGSAGPMLGVMDTKRVTTQALALSAAAALLLASCSDAGDESVDPETTQAPAADDGAEDQNTDETTEDATNGDTDDDTDGAAEDDGDNTGVLAAIELAEAETGGTAFEVDEEIGGT